MASVESMGVWSKYADYYVASEELEPGNGWDYRCFSILSETEDPKEIVTRIVERYGSYFEGIRTGQNDPDITLAAADLTKVSAVLGDVSKLASAMSGIAGGGEYPYLKKLRADVKSFGNLEDTRGGDAWNYDLVDLRHLAEQMKDRAPADSERLLADLDRLIIAKTANIEHAGGVTIYYPDSNISQYRSSSETYREAPYEWRELLKTVALPQKLEEIGSMAFCSCDNLEEIALPPSLTGLGSFAFFYCSALKDATLPGTLKKAGRGLFFECGALETISLSGAGGALRLIDGALYSADGKTLFACPALREGRFEVAEGTEEIAFGAFCDAQIGEVLLPESLKKIDAYAFHSCLSLAAPVLSDSLEELGPYAFGASILSLKYGQLAKEEQKIRIGRSVHTVGEHAFDLFPTRLFEVSPENEWYTGKDGFLMNPATDAVLQAAVLPGGVIRLPEGTAALEETLLKIEDYALGLGRCGYLHECAIPQGVEEIGRLGLNGLTNVTIGALPPGLRSLGEKALPWNMEGVLTIPETLTRIHEKAFDDCGRISSFAVGEGNPSYMEKDGVLYTADGKNLVSFPKGFSGKSLEIPDSVEEIGPYAFAHIWKMTRFVLPENVRREERYGRDTGGNCVRQQVCLYGGF